jgi:hypothetical protein
MRVRCSSLTSGQLLTLGASVYSSVSGGSVCLDKRDAGSSNQVSSWSRRGFRYGFYSRPPLHPPAPLCPPDQSVLGRLRPGPVWQLCAGPGCIFRGDNELSACGEVGVGVGTEAAGFQPRGPPSPFAFSPPTSCVSPLCQASYWHWRYGIAPSVVLAFWRQMETIQWDSI